MSRSAWALTLLATLCLVARAGAATSRPPEAPLVGVDAPPPPPPPEYLRHEEAGVRIAYHPATRERVRRLMHQAPRIRRELAVAVGREVLGRLELRVALDPSDLARLVPEPIRRASGEGSRAAVPEGLIALSEHALVVLAGGAHVGGDLETAVRRGMAYLAIDEVTARAAPRWLSIGFAVDFAAGDELGRARALWWAALSGALAPIAELDDRLETASVGSLAAAQAADAVRFLRGRGEGVPFARLLEALGAGESFEHATRSVYDAGLLDLERAWRGEVARRRGFVPTLLGGLAVGLGTALCALGWQRLRRRRSAESAAPAGERRKATRRSQGQRGQRSRTAKALPLPPDAGLPRISHKGRWHTLH
jgi:DNA-binding transcriptional ArsR family regulator